MTPGVHETLPPDFIQALKDLGVWEAFLQFAPETARDIGDWIASARDEKHREERIRMAIELVARHFAPLIDKNIDLREQPTNTEGENGV